ncbi:MAG: hypothetical protein KAH21_00740 [Spirochaetaceae bacterium]|nr:hypothetical protein [Spirochaetaceae bacterium]
MERAEEIIAEVYRQVLEVRNQGFEPSRVVMPSSLWHRVDDYRRTLGVIDGSIPDYLSENSLFGLEIWYASNPGIRVEYEQDSENE